MTVTLPRAGDLGIDFSFSRLGETDHAKRAAAIKAAGGRFVIRYSAGAASDPGHASYALNKGKLITPAEFKAYVAAGLEVYANDEWYESRVTEGAAAGKADGAAALKLWRSCGLAKGSSIYCSWDAAPSVALWPKVDAYLRAFNTALAGYYRVDCYGGTNYLKHALTQKIIRYGWRPNAGSWSNDALPYQPNTRTSTARQALLSASLDNTPAHIWQTGNYWFAKGADELMLLRAPAGGHLETLAAAAKPPAPPTPPAAPVGYYHADGHASTGITSPDGNCALVLSNDGVLTVRKYDPAVKHGVPIHTYPGS